MNFKAIKNNLQEIKYIKSLLKKYKSLLLPGRYYLFLSLRAICINEEKTLYLSKKYFNKKIKPSKTTWLISKLNETNYFFVKRNKNNLEKYEAIYSANNSDKVREVKLFSFKRKEILTFCISNKECDKQILEYENLHNYFKMPYVEKYLEFDNAYKILMVDFLIRPKEDKALESIVSSYINFTAKNDIKTKKTTEIISFKYDNEEINNALATISSNINKELIDLEFPICLQHGDLSRDNLIYGKCKDEEDFWWIDWEHLGERFFLYDYFFYMVNTAVYFNDREALDLYISGKCDEILITLFNNYKINYNSKFKKDYFMIFYIEFLKERVCKENNFSILNLYLDFLKSVEF